MILRLTIPAIGILLLTGCAGYRPFVCGPGYVGVGAFRDARIRGVGLPPHIDLKGVGALITNDRVAIGYTEAISVFRTQDLRDARIAMSRAEVAFGKSAEEMAFEFVRNAAKEGP